LAKGEEENTKVFYMYINQKRKVQEGIPPKASNTGKLVTTDKKVAEVLYSTFASIFSNNCSPHSPQMFGLVGGDSGSEDQARDHPRNLIIH